MHKNEKLQILGQVKDGQRHDLTMRWHASRKKRKQELYRNGKLISSTTFESQ